MWAGFGRRLLGVTAAAVADSSSVPVAYPADVPVAVADSSSVAVPYSPVATLAVADRRSVTIPLDPSGPGPSVNDVLVPLTATATATVA